VCYVRDIEVIKIDKITHFEARPFAGESAKPDESFSRARARAQEEMRIKILDTYEVAPGRRRLLERASAVFGSRNGRAASRV